MKLKSLAAILFAGVMTLLAPRPVSAAVSVSITYFHHELAPYGRWVYTPGYGEVWYPTVVSAGWAPYVDGEWVYTDCGWTWVSYDPFGDPFHYGTWVWVDRYGWCWEPGYVWGPAWVTWAWTDGYIGWAPLPATFAITAGGYSGGAVTVAQSQYVFVPINRFADTNVSTARIAATQNSTILAGAQRATRFSVAGGIVHTGGPPAALVERATGRTLRAVSVSSHKLKPTTISAAGVRSGRSIPLVAPARERAARVNASKPGKPPAAKMVHRAPSSKGTRPETAAGRHLEKQKAPARVARIEKHPPPPRQARQAVAPRHEARPSRRSAEKPSTFTAGQPARQTHREKVSREKVSSSSPARSVERKHEASPPAVVREERRTAMNRAAEPARPARHEAPALQAPRHEAPPPQVARHEAAAQPRPGPPPAVAARPPEQPKGQPGGNKKEKPQG